MTYGAQSETSELRKNISLVPEKMANAIQSKVPKMIVEIIYQ